MDSEKGVEYKFGGVEYGVFAAVLVASSAIGVFYGCFGSKQKTTEEFLMANRKMSPLPVALSLVCSFVSAVSLLGNPVEVYFYGAQCGLTALAIIPMSLTVSYLYVPVFFNLQVSSAFEYLEMRFSKGTKIFVSVLATFQMVIYMAIVVYGPSLALEQVTGISTRVSTAVIFIVCIVYSSLGGLKAILWTDALQALIMTGSLTVVVVRGLVDVGLSTVFERASNSNRLEFFNFDPDPRTRHTFWTATIGAFFQWLPMQAATQPQIQRYLSVPTLKDCRRAINMSMVGLVLITILWLLAGLVLYAKYFDCDPVKSGLVTSSDQLLPQFVMETSGEIKGLPGLFVAGLTCASLSTISTMLNGVAAIVTYDYMKPLLPNMNDERLSTLSKFVSLFFGAISFGFVFIVENAGSIVPFAANLFSIIIGPTLGVFTLGMFFPWANTLGTFVGLTAAILITTLMTIGTYIAETENLLPNQSFLLSTEGCGWSNSTDRNKMEFPPLDWKNQGDDLLIQILSMSFNWSSALAFLMTILFGLGGSWMGILRGRKLMVEDRLLSAPILKLWNKLMPLHLKKWVIYTDKEDKD